MDLSERQHINRIVAPKEQGPVIVIDNGAHGLRAGFQGDMCLSVRNRVYKNKDRISFDPFPLATMKTMFDSDVVVGLDTLEHTVDMVLGHLKPNKLDTLIMTSTPHSPTEAEVLDLLFSVYKFEQIQLGYDFVYAYHRYFKQEDCLVIALKYSSLIVSYIQDGKIACMHRLGFGGHDLMEYINSVMVEKYKECRKDYRDLISHTRVADNYDKEALDIYAQMCAGDYGTTLFLSEATVLKEDKTPKKFKKPPTTAGPMPVLDYALLETEDTLLGPEEIKEKRKQKMLLFGTLHRLKVKIRNVLTRFEEAIEVTEDAMDKQKDPKAFLDKKKARFASLVRLQELRNKLRQDAKDRKTREFMIKNKEGALDPEEQRVRESIADAEDDGQETELVQKLDQLSAEILELDPDFIPFYANTVEILRGDNIGRQCVNIELIKWPEILFYPSIISLEYMGLAEILMQLSAKYKIENVLLCGGFSFIPNMANRIRSILTEYGQDPNFNIKVSEDTEGDSYAGAVLSPFCPVYTRKDFTKWGAVEMVARNRH